MAFSLDEALAHELQKLTGLEIRFVSSHDDAVMSSYSTMTSSVLEMDAESGGQRQESEGYLTTVIAGLDQADYRVSAQLASPMAETLASFDLLKRELLIITLIAYWRLRCWRYICRAVSLGRLLCWLKPLHGSAAATIPGRSGLSVTMSLAYWLSALTLCDRASPSAKT